MTEIHEHMDVRSDAHSARDYLRAFFVEQKYMEPDAAFIPSRADIHVRDFVLHSPGGRSANYNAIFDLDWEVYADGPFPHFCGTLSVRQSDDGDTCSIALDGGYVAPFGTAGRIFDTMFGHAIARSTVRNLLRRLRAFVEERCTQNAYQTNMRLTT